MHDKELTIGLIPERIEAAITQSGMSKAEVARRIGVTPGALHQWCTGEKMPSVRNAGLLAYVTGQRIGYLFGEDADGVPPGILEEAQNWRRMREILRREGLLPESKGKPSEERWGQTSVRPVGLVPA